MTEEIIIDCAFYKDGVCASPINKTCEYCKNIDVSKCYHKQLKRLEQENKEFKKQIESQKGLITVGGKQQYQYLQKIDELEQENKELGEKAFLAEQNVRTTASTFCEKDNKIIELEQENRELKAYKDVNEDFKKAWDELNRKYTEVLKLAKENADINEYCLQELEKENEQYRSALEEIREIITSDNSMIIDKKVYFELQCGEPVTLKLQKIYSRINEVLK